MTDYVHVLFVDGFPVRIAKIKRQLLEHQRRQVAHQFARQEGILKASLRFVPRPKIELAEWEPDF